MLVRKERGQEDFHWVTGVSSTRAFGKTDGLLSYSLYCVFQIRYHFGFSTYVKKKYSG